MSATQYLITGQHWPLSEGHEQNMTEVIERVLCFGKFPEQDMSRLLVRKVIMMSRLSAEEQF
jgi:hypothetical protein